MNRPHKDKRKFTYFENRQVFDTLVQIAKEKTAEQGRIVTVPELIREDTLAVANKFLRKHGKQPIEYDTGAGKFAPGSGRRGSAAECQVDIQGKIEVRDRLGNKLNEWKHVEQIPQLLRSYPKCKIVFVKQFHNVLDYV